MFLDEHVWAPMIMSVAFIVAVLGVVALGAYVVYCDRKNRAGEAELAASTPIDGGAHPSRADHQLLASSPAGESEPAAAPATRSPADSRRRNAGAPPES